MSRSSWEYISPFLRPILHLIEDPDISEIMRNGDGKVFVERSGKIVALPDVVLPENDLLTAVESIARVLGGDVSPDAPLFDGRLDDGSRVAVTLPPISQGGITFNVRKFNSKRFTADE